MNLKEDIRSITELKTHPASIVSHVSRTHRPTVITQNGKATVVVQDIHTYEETRRALMILKLAAEGETDIRAGRFKKQPEVFRHFDKKYRV